MKLKLTRPIVVFDLETTGINLTHDRIIELSYIKVMPDGNEKRVQIRVNPQMPIPPESTDIHHITDADVANEKTFKEIAPDIAREFAGCDLAGYNSNRFDIPMLAEEFDRAGVDFDFSRARFVDVQNIFHKKEQRTLVAAYKFYCGLDLENAHSSMADTDATYEVLKAQLERYDDLPADVPALSDFTTMNRNIDLVGRLVKDDKGRAVINFGKYKGRLAAEVLEEDHGYYAWVMQGDFTSDTKRAFTRIKLRQQK